MKLLDAHVNGVPRHVSTKHCLTTAANMPTNIELETPQICWTGLPPIKRCCHNILSSSCETFQSLIFNHYPASHWGWCIPNPKIMAQVQVILTATIELTIELPDSKLKSLIVDEEIDVHKYIDVDIRNDFKSDFKRCNVFDLTIDVEDPTISSWETIEKNDGTQLSFDGYKLSKVQ